MRRVIHESFYRGFSKSVRGEHFLGASESRGQCDSRRRRRRRKIQFTRLSRRAVSYRTTMHRGLTVDPDCVEQVQEWLNILVERGLLEASEDADLYYPRQLDDEA